MHGSVRSSNSLLRSRFVDALDQFGTKIQIHNPPGVKAMSAFNVFARGELGCVGVVSSDGRED